LTGPVLEVDTDALNADGRRLESLGQPLHPSNCAPPASDSTSLGATEALNTHEMALIEVLNYSSQVRKYGGAVVRSAAVVFELADQAGAASIHRVDNTDSPSSGPVTCRRCHRLPVNHPSRAFPRCRRCHRWAAIYSPPSCIQARVQGLSRVPWNFGGGPVSIRLRSPDH
jgi:hypothetical protein